MVRVPSNGKGTKSKRFGLHLLKDPHKPPEERMNLKAEYPHIRNVITPIIPLTHQVERVSSDKCKRMGYGDRDVTKSKRLGVIPRIGRQVTV